VIAAPPSLAGAVKEIEADVAELAVADTEVGAPGAAIAVAGKTAVTVIEAASVFTALLVTLVAPAIEKKFAVMPLSV
jgi:hypothetical protein